MEPLAQPQTLQRSNAITGELHRENIGSVSSDGWTAGNPKPAKPLKYARQQDEKKELRAAKKIERTSRQNSFESSISDSASADVVFQALPMGLFATTQSNAPKPSGWSRTGASGSPVAKIPAEARTKPRKRWGIFGRKKDDSQRPVDTSIKWDGSDRERQTHAASGSAGFMADALLGMAGPSHDLSQRKSRSNPKEEAQVQHFSVTRHSATEDSLAEAVHDNARLLEQLAQAVEPGQTQVECKIGGHVQCRREGGRFDSAPKSEQSEVSNSGNQKRPHPVSLRNIGWSQVDGDELQQLIHQFTDGRRSDASPVDSGVDMGEGKQPMDTGKGRARSVSSSSTYHTVLGPEDYLTATEEAQGHPDDFELHRKHALAQTLESECQRVRQEDEDARRAGQVQEEETIARRIQEEEERIAAELASCRECVCCGDEKHALDYPAKPATADCTHTSTTCIDCMHSWLSSELDSKGCESLKCPECPALLSYDAMQLLSNEATFIRYEHLLLRTTLSSLPEFAWCLSPTCKSGQLNVQNGNYMECDRSLGGCGYRQCLLHQIPWHTGETCQAYDHRVSGRKAAEEEAATHAILDDISKICPGKHCGWRIQKSDGCDHMTCRKCKWQFCWECLASHREIKREGNTAHRKWCKFHSENLERNARGEAVVSWPFNAHA